MKLIFYKKKILFPLIGATIIFVLIYSSSCTKAKVCCEMPANPMFMILVENNQSQDLFNPQTKNGYNPQNIQVYYLKNNKATLAYDYNLDHPALWNVIKDSLSGKYFLSVNASNRLNKQNQSTSFIQWNNTDIDKIVCQFQENGYNPFKKSDAMEIWYGMVTSRKIPSI